MVPILTEIAGIIGPPDILTDPKDIFSGDGERDKNAEANVEKWLANRRSGNL